MQTIQYERPTTDEIVDIKYTLNDAWIAGMIGAIEVKPRNGPYMLVTMSSDNPLQLVAIRRPSRNMSENPLTAEEEEEAIHIAKQKLRVGLPLNKTEAPVSILENTRLRLYDEDENPYYLVEFNNTNERVLWDDLKEITIALPVHEKLENRNIENALTRVGDGIEENANESLIALLEETPKEIIQRAIVYLSTYSKKIKLHRISRDGSGTYKAVIVEDVGAYQFMLKISIIYPAALSPNGPGKFKVNISPLLWIVRDKIKEFMAKNIEGSQSDGWKNIKFKDETRMLRGYQTEIMNDMIESRKRGEKGSFIWAPVGLGKTMAVLKYLQYCKEHETLPEFIIYTLPESAIKSIIEEIKYFDIPINLIIPLSNIKNRRDKYKSIGVTISQNCEPIPFAINLIEHDHLRRCDEILTRFAPQCMFIVDEVHKTMNDTKRTSAAIEIAYLSKDFIVLTGTPIIDSNTYKLIGWLEQVVPYEVNTKNFWVAANSMIAKKVNTGVKVVKEEVLADFTAAEEKLYYSLVPPALGGRNVRPSNKEWMTASDICYQAANRKMIDEVKYFNNQGRGVMLVGKDKKHTELLKSLLIRHTKIKSDDVFVMGTGDSIFLTDEAVQKGDIHDYKVVIVPIRKAEGYTLTRLSVMITSVYPSNNATRTQIEGRINRVSQKRKEIDYRVVHVGVLTSILRNYNNAKNLALALEGLAKLV